MTCGGFICKMPAEDRPGKATGERPESELESVLALMRLVTNAARVFHSYLPNNQLYLGFAERLGEKFPAHLDSYGELVLAVGQYELLFHGEQVYAEADPARSLALKLYRDGVRRVRFLPGIEKEEIVGFVRILSRPIAADSLEDDIVTLLWEQDFSHIKYAIIEEVAVREAGAGAREAPAEGTGGAAAAAPGAAGEAATGGGVAASGAQAVPEAATVEARYRDVRAEIQEIAEQVRASLAALDEGALHELQALIEKEAGEDIAGRAALVLLDTAIMEKDSEVTASTVTLLRQLVRAHIADGHVASAADDLTRLTKLMAPESGLSAQDRALVEKEIRGLGEPEVLQHLASLVEASAVSPDRELHRFLLAWGEAGVPAAIALAGMVKDDRTIIDALLEMSRGHPASLVAGLISPAPGAVKAALRVLREVADASFAPELAGALQQGSPDVRLEAVFTLQAWSGEQAAEMLEPLVEDGDQRVRSATVQALGRVRGARAVEVLARMICEKTFLARPLEEKRQAFAALAQAAGEAALPMLGRVLREKRWVHAGKQNETRACAAHALGLVGTPAAAEILAPFQDDRAAIVRAACRTALHRIATAKKAEPQNG